MDGNGVAGAAISGQLCRRLAGIRTRTLSVRTLHKATCKATWENVEGTVTVSKDAERVLARFLQYKGDKYHKASPVRLSFARPLGKPANFNAACDELRRAGLLESLEYGSGMWRVTKEGRAYVSELIPV